jgi:hypothetical protein
MPKSYDDQGFLITAPATAAAARPTSWPAAANLENAAAVSNVQKAGVVRDSAAVREIAGGAMYIAGLAALGSVAAMW